MSKKKKGLMILDCVKHLIVSYKYFLLKMYSIIFYVGYCSEIQFIEFFARYVKIFLGIQNIKMVHIIKF